MDGLKTTSGDSTQEPEIIMNSDTIHHNVGVYLVQRCMESVEGTAPSNL